jgi:hypothetical protein
MAARAESETMGERVTVHLTDCGEGTRNMVVLDVPPGKRWYAPRIAFFQSSATSNGPLNRYRKNTFFPTLGISNSEEMVPNMESATVENDFFVKTGLFKGILTIENFNSNRRIPQWMDELLTEYCNTVYPGLLDLDYDNVYVDNPKDLERFTSFLEASIEIPLLLELCNAYFSDVWQIAMSIGLSRFYGNGLWVEDGDSDDIDGERILLRKFKKFADFIDTKCVYAIEGGAVFVPVDDREFLTRHNAQCDFSTVEQLPVVTLEKTKYNVFAGISTTRLTMAIRSYRPRGGKTRRKRRRLFKTRHQKRR